jgi:beta-glucanase (GH16 family)
MYYTLPLRLYLFEEVLKSLRQTNYSSTMANVPLHATSKMLFLTKWSFLQFEYSILIFFLLITSMAQSQPSVDPYWTLVWNSDFTAMNSLSDMDGGWLRANNYHKTWPGRPYGEAQVYKSDNLSLTDNGLVLTARREEATCSTCDIQNYHYTSGQITSWHGWDGNHRIKYGYVEAKIKMSRTFGTWPAFWFWTETPECDGVAPNPDAGCPNPPPANFCTPSSVYSCDYEEIDGFEMVPGSKDNNPYSYNYNQISTWYNATTNYYINSNTSQTQQNIQGYNYWINDYSQFHTYGIEWTPTIITWYLDNIPIRNISNPGINQFNSIIINQAMLPWIQDGTSSMGSYNPTVNWFENYYNIPSSMSNIGFSNINTTPSEMTVSYVKYYTLNGAACPVTSTVSIPNANISTWANWVDIVRKSINLGPGSGAITTTLDQTLRATDYIQIDGSFYVPIGSALTLNVTPCF